MSERSPLLSSTPEPETSPVSRRHNLSPDSPDDDGARISLLHGAVIASSIFVLIFVLTFGVAVITTIQSSIAADLDVTSGASWFVSAYLIAATSVTPIAGKLCEIFSPQQYLLVSTVVQVIGLLITAFASTFSIFTVGRVLCGTGAAAVTPVAYILVTKLASPRRRGLLFGLINCGYTAGVALGAVIGGELEPRIGWRAVFWIQTPICLAAGLVTYFAVPSEASPAQRHEQKDLLVMQKMATIDFLGVATLMGSVILLLYSLASSEIQTTPVVLSVAALALFCLIESQWATDPIVPPAIICSRAMLFTGVSTVGLMCARWGVVFYTPTYAIAVLGWSQSKAGVLLIPTNLGFGVGSILVGLVHIRRSGSFYSSCLVCFALYVVEHWGLSLLITSHPSIWLFVAGLFFDGFIAGALLTYNLAHLLHRINPIHHIVVIPLNATFRSLSGSIGSSLEGGLLVRTLQDELHKGFEARGLYGRGELIMQLLSRPMLVQSLHGPERQVAVASYAHSIRYLLAIGSLWTIAMLVLQAGTGWAAPDDVPEDAKKRDVVNEENTAIQDSSSTP